RRALEALREPLEEGAVHIARASMSLRFPAEFLLLAAMNPCPCGYSVAHLPEAAKKASGHTLCMCSFDQLQRYRARLSGPLLDRIDLHVGVLPVPFRDYARPKAGQTSAQVARRVAQARGRQAARLGPCGLNARMSAAQLRLHVPLVEPIGALLATAVDAHALSNRAVGRVLKVARTLADLEDCEVVHSAHVREALSFRLLEAGCSRPAPPSTDHGGAGPFASS
ncbi:MAG: ATP-binding protein, partial [Deltaproteobacteria bacterium]